nr:hypothetical protein BaRGS_016052 [Batillaria attramentaria]
MALQKNDRDDSRVIKYDANTGTLQITGITQREEGFFNCKAKNTYQGQEAVAISPKIEVRIARVGDFPDEGTQQTYPFMEGQYAKLPCDENMPIHYGPTTFKWYTPRNGTLFEVATDGRRFIDESGALHFVYIEKADENVHGNREYQCAMSNTIQGLIKLGGKKQVFVNSAGGPRPPEWYKNGDRMDRRADPTKYVFSDQERKLTIKDVSKETDIACFHCYVENSIGREFSAGCLNVILPITVTAQPEKMEKKVSKGDIVNLTVVATADALTPVKYRWTFKDITYEQNDAPPHVTFNPDTLLAYINTSTLTEEDFATIGGVYRREIYHQYESVYVDVEVDVDLEVDVDASSCIDLGHFQSQAA